MRCCVLFRFSNPALQALLVLAKKQPPREGAKLLVIGTTSEAEFIKVRKKCAIFVSNVLSFALLVAVLVLLVHPFLAVFAFVRLFLVVIFIFASNSSFSDFHLNILLLVVVLFVFVVLVPALVIVFPVLVVLPALVLLVVFLFLFFFLSPSSSGHIQNGKHENLLLLFI